MTIRLTRHGECELIRRCKAGDKDARDTLLAVNLALLVTLAKRFKGREIAYMDLMQTGIIALLQAIDSFDLRRRTKLSTFATWRIFAAMQAAVGSAAIIPLTNHGRRKGHQAPEVYSLEQPLGDNKVTLGDLL